MRLRSTGRKKVLQVVEKIPLCRALDSEKVLQQARRLKQALQQVMRSFGRACRGQGRIFVKLVRKTEQQLLDIGQDVAALGLCAQRCLQSDSWPEVRKAQLERQLQDALEAHRHIEKQSHLLIRGKKPAKAKIVNAYDPTIAPIKKGKSNCPCQFGKKVGLIAEMATGFIFGFHGPDGNPDDASYVLPLVDTVEKAFDQQALQEKAPLSQRFGL